MTLTDSDSEGRKTTVVVSGNELVGLKDENGKPLKDEAADIFAHEMVGHAIPYATATTDTANAVENENKVREQQPVGRNAKRAAEPDHDEQDTVAAGRVN